LEVSRIEVVDRGGELRPFSGMAAEKVRLPPDPSPYAQLQLSSGILAFTFAAIALVRFRGTRDRLPLILACGFVIVGFALASSSPVFFHASSAGTVGPENSG